MDQLENAQTGGVGIRLLLRGCRAKASSNPELISQHHRDPAQRIVQPGLGGMMSDSV
jgi:hypothetical protein